MKQNLLFFDLDGTLCPGRRLKVPAATQALFPQLVAQGNVPVVVTGRSLYEVQPVLDQLHIRNYLLSNGCYVVANGRVIANHQLPRTMIEKLRQLAQQRGDDLAYFNQHGFAVTGINARTQGHIQRLGLTKVPIEPDFYLKQPVNFMNAYVATGAEAVYRQLLGQQAHLIRYEQMAVNIVPNAASKAQAIQTFLAATTIKVGATYAFGDQDNDLGMFAQADYGIAMAAATPALKQRATYVAQAENGVLAGLRHYGLLTAI